MSGYVLRVISWKLHAERDVVLHEIDTRIDASIQLFGVWSVERDLLAMAYFHLLAVGGLQFGVSS